MIDKSSESVQIPFDPYFRGKLCVDLAKKFFSQYKFEKSESKKYITREYGDPFNVSLKEIIGHVESVIWTGEVFVADVIIYPTEYKRFIGELIESKSVNLGWSISGKVERVIDDFSKYCFFAEYEQYRVSSIENLYYFFLKKP